MSAPRPTGRVVRLGFGVVLLHGTWNLARFGPSEIGRQLANPVEWLIHMAIAPWLLPAVVDIGWARGVGRRIRPLALATVDHLIQSFLLFDRPNLSDRRYEGRVEDVIDGVDVTGSSGKRGDPGRQGLGSNGHNVEEAGLATRGSRCRT